MSIKKLFHFFLGRGEIEAVAITVLYPTMLIEHSPSFFFRVLSTRFVKIHPTLSLYLHLYLYNAMNILLCN